MNVVGDKITVFVARPAADGKSREFLQLHRVGGDEIGGTWQTVRGTIEPGETATAAALRELREETGIVSGECYRLGTVETFYDVWRDAVVHSAPFLALIERDAAVRLNDEHDALRWIPEREAERAFMWPSEKPLLREIRAELFGAGGACKPLLLIRR